LGWWHLVSYPPYFPKFLLGPDPDHTPSTHADWLKRAQWAYPSIVQQEPDRVMRLNFGYGEEPFTVEDCIVWAEARAQAVLP
jgi:hypothetical protein